MTIQDVGLIINIIGAALFLFIIYGFIFWLIGITIYEFCVAHAYIFKRCYKKIFGQSPSNNATVMPFTSIDNISARPIRTNPIIVSAQSNPYVVASREIIIEV